MRIFAAFLLLSVTLLTACVSYEKPDSGLDCGRQFINATYQGNFKRAKQLLAPGEKNKQILIEKFEKDFRSRKSFEKEKLSLSSIVITKTLAQADTVQYVTYKNAYTQQELALKCILFEGEWKTDLIYSFPQ